MVKHIAGSTELDILEIVKLREDGKKIIFTNGVFDLLHDGHRYLLSEAKKFGDILVVGINSDLSVKRLKGSSRPVQFIADRVAALKCLPTVDFVLEFEEDTPLDLIKRIRPYIVVKGSDYNEQQVVGLDVVTEYGGRVELIERVGGHSTTGIIEN